MTILFIGKVIEMILQVLCQCSSSLFPSLGTNPQGLAYKIHDWKKNVFVFPHHLSHRFGGSELYFGIERLLAGIFYTFKFKDVLRGLFSLSMNMNHISAESVTYQFSKGTVTQPLQENTPSQASHKYMEHETFRLTYGNSCRLHENIWTQSDTNAYEICIILSAE